MYDNRLGIFAGVIAGIIGYGLFITSSLFQNHIWIFRGRGHRILVVILTGIITGLIGSGAAWILTDKAKNSIVESKSLRSFTNAELRQAVRSLAPKIRAFQRKLYEDRATDLYGGQSPAEGTITPEERTRRWRQANMEMEKHWAQQAEEFGPLRAQAISYHNELFFRFRRPKPSSDDKTLSMSEQSAIRVLEMGGLVGPSPAGDLADYLEALANSLPDE